MAGGGGAGKASQPHSNNKVINRHISSAAEAGDSSRLFEKIQLHLHDMNGINLATAFHRVAKLVSGGVLYPEATKEHPVFQELFQAIVQHITGHSLRHSGGVPDAALASWEMPVQCMSIVSWSCATLQLRHKALCTAIGEVSATRLDEFQPYELSNLLWSFAKLSFSPCDLFKNVTARLLRRQDGEFKVQCLSTIAWSFATMKRRILVVFGSLAKEMVAHAHEMKPQEISNALWAFAKSRCANAELFQALGDAAAVDSVIWSFKPQELSNTAWAFATVGLRHPALFGLIEKVSIRKRHEMVPQNIANMLWSFAKLQVEPQADLYPLLLEAAERALPQHKPQELSAVVWAAAQACPRGHSGFFSAAARCCIAHLQGQDPQEFSMNGLGNLVKAFAVVEMDAPEIFAALIDASLPLLPQFKPLALSGLFSGTVRAAGNLCFSDQSAEITHALVIIAEHVTSQIPKFQTSELQEVADALGGSPLLEEMECLQRLERELAAALLRAPEAGAKAKDVLRAGPQSSRSVGCMSTSAEESVDEDEDDVAWSTSYHGHGRASSYSSSMGYHSDPTKRGGYRSEASTAASSSSAGGFGSSLGLIGPPPGLGLSQEEPLAAVPPAAAAGEGWTPWRVPLWAEHAQASPGFGGLGGGLGGPPIRPMKVQMNAPTLQELVRLHAAPTFVSESGMSETSPRDIGLVGLGCLCEVRAIGSRVQHVPVNEWALTQKGNTCGIKETFCWLRDPARPLAREARVVLKRVPAGLPSPKSFTAHPLILRPEAMLKVKGSRFLVYPFCAQGNLAEWLTWRAAAGVPLRPEEGAKLVRDVLSAAEVLLAGSASAISAVQPDEILICEDGVARVREPLPGKPGGWQDALKWLSPDEAAGRMQSVDNTWPALAFRLGLLLYCLGSGAVDPYPGTTGEAVLMSMLSQSARIPEMRPNMASYRGPEILRRMVAACLQVDGQSPPTKATLVAVLDAITKDAQQHEPMKVTAAAAAP